MDDHLRDLAKTLYEHRHEAVRVPFRDGSGADFQPVERDCHANVDRWSRLHPDQVPVRGWLVIEQFDRGYCRFVAHSVVRDEQGRLFDVTLGSTHRHRFLPHRHTDEEYILMLSRRSFVHIDHFVGR